MYLRAEKYVSGRGFFGGDEEIALYHELVEKTGLGDIVDPETPSGSITLTVAYWRKANAIHDWFVQKCQNGVDECQLTYVSRGQLEDLRTLCLRAIAEKDAELLPPQEGFFFGGTDVDEWYWQSLKDTVAQLDRVLKAPEDVSLYYQSSW